MKKNYIIQFALIVLGIISFFASAIGSASSYVRPDGLLVEPFGLIVMGGMFGFIFITMGAIIGLSLSLRSLFNNPKKSDKWIFGLFLAGSYFLVCYCVYATLIVKHNIANENKAAMAPVKSASVSVKDATYAIDGVNITLKNGVSDLEILPGSASRKITRYFGNEALGDLNDDGMVDTAVILTQTSGGSGTFYYLVVALQTENGYKGTNGILLGDRIMPQPTEIKNDQIIANFATIKPGEAFTAQPSVGVTKYFKVINRQLVEVDNIAQISDRKWQWVGTEMKDRKRVVPKKSDTFSITFKDGNISGTTDCNNFSGSFKLNEDKLSFGAFAATLMYCEGSQDGEFEESLSEVEGYRMDNNQLLLKIKNGLGVMAFE